MTEKIRTVKKSCCVAVLPLVGRIMLFEGPSSREEENASVEDLFKDRLRVES